MNNCNTPQNHSLLVACSTAAMLLMISIPASAVSQPGAVRGNNVRMAARPQNVIKRAPDVTRPRAVTNQPQVKPVTPPDPKALHAASLRGDLRMVQQLVKDRVNIHYANSDRETALHMAASRGHLPIVIFLMSKGANKNARTIGNWLPLHHAVRFNRQKVANYLMAKGSPPHYKTSDGLNSMDMALVMRNQRMINLVRHYMNK